MFVFSAFYLSDNVPATLILGSITLTYPDKHLLLMLSQILIYGCANKDNKLQQSQSDVKYK